MQAINRLMHFDPKGIGELLAAGRLVVPLNQREYAWEDDQVEDLIPRFCWRYGFGFRNALSWFHHPYHRRNSNRTS